MGSREEGGREIGETASKPNSLIAAMARSFILKYDCVVPVLDCLSASNRDKNLVKLANVSYLD